MSADPEWDVMRGFWRAAYALKVEVFACVIKFVFRPAEADDLERFLGNAAPVLAINTEGIELFQPIADRCAKHESTVRQVIDDGAVFGDAYWMVKRHQQNVGANVDPLGACGNGAGKGQQ